MSYMCSQTQQHGYDLALDSMLSHSPTPQRGIGEGGGGAHVCSKTHEAHDTWAGDNGCMHRWISGGKEMKCLSEMQIQMVEFIPRRRESGVMPQHGTFRIPLTG